MERILNNNLYIHFRLREAYDAESSDDNSNLEREQQKAKRERNELIHKQFALRKNPKVTKLFLFSHLFCLITLLQVMSNDTIDQLFSKRAKVIAASSTSSKVNGLNLVIREQYLSKISEVLSENYEECCSEPVYDKQDIEDCGVDLEYSIFKANTTITMYRNAIAKMVTIFFFLIVIMVIFIAQTCHRFRKSRRARVAESCIKHLLISHRKQHAMKHLATCSETSRKSNGCNDKTQHRVSSQVPATARTISVL